MSTTTTVTTTTTTYVMPAQMPVEQPPTFKERLKLLLDELETTLYCFKDNQDPLSARIFLWGFELIEIDWESLTEEQAEEKFNERLNHLNTKILVDSILNEPIRHPAIEEEGWVWEASLVNNYVKFYPDSPFNAKPLTVNSHEFAECVIGLFEGEKFTLNQVQTQKAVNLQMYPFIVHAKLTKLSAEKLRETMNAYAEANQKFSETLDRRWGLIIKNMQENQDAYHQAIEERIQLLMKTHEALVESYRAEIEDCNRRIDTLRLVSDIQQDQIKSLEQRVNSLQHQIYDQAARIQSLGKKKKRGLF